MERLPKCFMWENQRFIERDKSLSMVALSLLSVKPLTQEVNGNLMAKQKPF